MAETDRENLPVSTAQASEEQQSQATAEISAQTSEVLVKLSSQTRALQAPVLGCALSSVAGAVIMWLLSYASYLGDSTASAVACLALLVALLVPGMFLGWVYVSLRRVSKLPGRFNLPAQEIPTGVVTPAPETGASFFSRCLERVRRRVKAALGVWSLLEYSDGVKSVGGPRWFLSFLAMPASQIIVATVLFANAIVVLVAVYTILRALLGLI